MIYAVLGVIFLLLSGINVKDYFRTLNSDNAFLALLFFILALASGLAILSRVVTFP